MSVFDNLLDGASKVFGTARHPGIAERRRVPARGDRADADRLEVEAALERIVHRLLAQREWGREKMSAATSRTP